MATIVAPMTAEELDAMPDDGIDRELIRGELRETTMTRRNRLHTSSEARIAHELLKWLESQPRPNGNVHSGEVGCNLRRDPVTSVGIDVAYFSAETLNNQSGESTMIDGPPVLAVEILSPSDQQGDIDEKLAEYLDCGVSQVWIVNPTIRTVTIHRSDAPPRLVNEDDELDGEPHLPGFCVPVARFF